MARNPGCHPPEKRRWFLLVGVLLLFLFPLGARAQDKLQWTTNYYNVTGASLEEIRQSLNQSHPWKENSSRDGNTAWRIDWNFGLAPSAGGFRCRDFTTRTVITVTLPRWVPPTNAPTALKEIWYRYITALAQHEHGHVLNALASVAEQHKRVMELGEESSREDMRKKINDLANKVLEDFRRRDREYDDRTEHGARQGAALPLSDGERRR